MPMIRKKLASSISQLTVILFIDNPYEKIIGNQQIQKLLEINNNLWPILQLDKSSSLFRIVIGTVL